MISSPCCRTRGSDIPPRCRRPGHRPLPRRAAGVRPRVLPHRLCRLRGAAASTRRLPVGAPGGPRPPPAIPRAWPPHLAPARRGAGAPRRRPARRRDGPLDPAGPPRQPARPRRSDIHRPRTAMLLAAGLGPRMRPLTEHTAKPLLPLGGRALLDHALDRLAAAGVATVVVNAYWQADRVAAHLAARSAAGRRRGSCCGRKASCWTPAAACARRSTCWARPVLRRQRRRVLAGRPAPRPAAPRRRVRRHGGRGAAGAPHLPGACRCRLRRLRGGPAGATCAAAREREVVPYVYAGVQLIAPALLDAMPDGPFSMNLAWDRAIASGPAAGGGA